MHPPTATIHPEINSSSSVLQHNIPSEPLILINSSIFSVERNSTVHSYASPHLDFASPRLESASPIKNFSFKMEIFDDHHCNRFFPSSVHRLKVLAAQDLLFFSSRKLAVIIIERNGLTILALKLDAKVCLQKLNAILFVCKITMNVLLWGKKHINKLWLSSK